MYKDKLVSIITPTYNSASFIEQTVQSVILQEYQEWELICVDDCSSDNTVGILEGFANKDNRIKVIKLEENGGAAVSRNVGIKVSKGRYLAFLDSDDLWTSDKLMKQVEFMMQKNAVLSFTSYLLIDEFGNSKNKVIRSLPKVNYKGLLKNTIIGMSTSMIDRFKLNNEVVLVNIRTRQDVLLWLSILKEGHVAYGINQVLVKYRVRSNSISSNKLKAARQTWRIYFEHEKLGFIPSLFYFMHYALNAVIKRI